MYPRKCDRTIDNSVAEVRDVCLSADSEDRGSSIKSLVGGL